MNREAIKTEIEKILSTVKQPLIKQYPASKAQIEKLTELGLIEFMPTMRKVGIGYTNAAAVIEAAISAKTAVFNRSGEGDEIAASKLYELLNEKPAPEPTPDYAQIFQDVLNARDEIENPDEADMVYDNIKANHTNEDGEVDTAAVKADWQAYRASVQRGRELSNRYFILGTPHHQSLKLCEPLNGSLFARLMDGYTGGSLHTFWHLCLMEKKQVNA